MSTEMHVGWDGVDQLVDVPTRLTQADALAAMPLAVGILPLGEADIRTLLLAEHLVSTATVDDGGTVTRVQVYGGLGGAVLHDFPTDTLTAAAIGLMLGGR